MSLHAARGGPHEDVSWSGIGRRPPRDVTFGDREGGGGMRRAAQQGAVRVDEASSASTFRELDEAFLQTQTKIWLGEVLHVRFDEDTLVADLLADGELLFQVSKIIWKRLLKKNREQLEQSKVYIFERLSFGRSSGKYMPYSKVDSFLKICQILGLAGIDLFTPSDVVEKRNIRKVCMCIRSVSKKSLIMHLNVPDFDIVTYTISMPNYVVGGIRRSLEQPQYSSSSSSGYSPHATSKALQQQIISGGQNDQHEDTHYDSDEAESKLSLLEPEESVDEDTFAAVLSQFSDTLNEKSEGYGESGHDKHGEKSLAESVGSLNIGIIDSEFMDSSPLIHNKESCSTHSASDQCSRTRTTKCSFSSEESDSTGSHLAFDSGKNYVELNNHSVADSERIDDGYDKSDHYIQGNGETLAEEADPQKETGTVVQHCDALACDRESVGSHLAFDSGKNYLELNNHSVADSERIDEGHDESDHYIQGNGETLADHPKKEEADLQKETGTVVQYYDALACDKESVCSSCEEPRCGLNGEPSDLSPESYSGLTPTHNTGGELPMVSEHPVNNIEPNMTGMTSDSIHRELNPEVSTRNEMDGSQSTDTSVMQDGSQCTDKPVESEDIAQDSITRRPEDDVPKSGKGVLKSVAGGITLVGAVFFMIHLRCATMLALLFEFAEKSNTNISSKKIHQYRTAAEEARAEASRQLYHLFQKNQLGAIQGQRTRTKKTSLICSPEDG